MMLDNTGAISVADAATCLRVLGRAPSEEEIKVRNVVSLVLFLSKSVYFSFSFSALLVDRS